MLVNPFNAPIFNGASPSGREPSSRLNAAVSQLVTGLDAGALDGDITEISAAIALQNQYASLRQSSSNVAEGISLAQVADQGIEQIQETLSRMREIAAQSNSDAVSDDDRAVLNTEFEFLRGQIDHITQEATFDGKKLLDGSLSGDGTLSFDGLVSGDAENKGGGELVIDPLDDSGLFGDLPLDILSRENAASALERIDGASQRVISTRAALGAFQQNLSFAEAVFASAAFNQEAAASVLSDADFADAATEYTQGTLLLDAGITFGPQIHKLPPSMLLLTQ